MPDFYYKPLIQKPIAGNRLKVFYTLVPFQHWAIHLGKRIDFNNSHEARIFAEKNDYEDGIHIVHSKQEQWQGLKPQVDALLGTKQP